MTRLGIPSAHRVLIVRAALLEGRVIRRTVLRIVYSSPRTGSFTLITVTVATQNELLRFRQLAVVASAVLVISEDAQHPPCSFRTPWTESASTTIPDPTGYFVATKQTRRSTNDITGPPDPAFVPTLTVVVNPSRPFPLVSFHSIKSTPDAIAIYS